MSEAEAREWFAVAVELDGENRVLREQLFSLIRWISERQELLELARTEIDKRWPTDERRAAA